MKKIISVFLFTLIIISLFDISLSESAKAENAGALEKNLKDYLSKKIPDANITSAKVVKLGDIRSVTRQEFLTDNIKEDLERPALVKVKGKCIYSDKTIDEDIELTLHKDKWGDWAPGQGTQSHDSLLWGMVGATLQERRCPENPKIIRQREVKRQEEEQDTAKRKAEKDAKEAARKAEIELWENAFVNNGDGTILDKETKLMWAAKDNGYDINAEDAKRYCENYRGGGYTDWRMPTEAELQYMRGNRYPKGEKKIGIETACGHAVVVRTDLIEYTCDYYWGYDEKGNIWYFPFSPGGRFSDASSGKNIRVLPVRSVKTDQTASTPIKQEKDTNDLERWNNLIDTKQYEQVVKELNAAISMTPNNHAAHYYRGMAYLRLNQYQRAIDDYNECIRINPEVHSYFMRGFAYLNLRNVQNAFDDFSKAISIKPDFARAYDLRGAIYLDQGKKESGCSDAQTACKLGVCDTLRGAQGKGYCL